METINPIHRAIHHFENHLTQPTSVEQAAAAAGYSRSHFSRTFASLTGLTPVGYLRQRRLSEAARELVASPKRILDIALDYQFQSQEAFTRSFKQEFGVSPGYYRQQRRLRRLLHRVRLGCANLLYPGRGIDTAPPIFVPKPKVVTAILTPRARIYPSAETAPPKPPRINVRLAHRQDLVALCRLYDELHQVGLQGVPERSHSQGGLEYFDGAGFTHNLGELIGSVATHGVASIFWAGSADNVVDATNLPGRFACQPSKFPMTQLLDAVNLTIWVAEVNAQVVGLAEVYLRVEEGNRAKQPSRYGFLQSLIVNQRWRGRDIGKQLLAAAESWCKAQGATELRLNTWESAAGPLGFYTNRGYHPLRRTMVRPL